MFNEKVIVNDALSMLNNNLLIYANAISQCSNVQLRNIFQQIRNQEEQFQYDLYKIAEQKGYYKAAQQASLQDIQQVKSELGAF
ncbi:Coat F domain-containing protein [Caloramator fervidus]|uniref:Coat F domain-containing protein n=1 Tax=Caloramator fervidus TaxID=29344 RepID=A0A1H5T276_9CLOT|nr:spore coat protein [Caloramator fervidus]SEF56913.1 Coat F domain-containing protein [Caloramator fervidus]